MIVPSIDLMNGKAVQLRQGKEHVFTSERDPVELAREFNRYGEVAVIDLDAALSRGDNIDLIKKICRVADVRAGGGVRDKNRARELLRAGAAKIIIGTAAAPEFLNEFPREKLIVALDHRNGEVLDRGWTEGTGESVIERGRRLAPYCGSFLVTFVESEGGMKGIDKNAAVEIKRSLDTPITIAGGVTDTKEATALLRDGFEVQVGMALYKGKIDLSDAVVSSIDFEKNPLIPTIVCDEAGQVLMLAFSSRESLALALKEGKGIYQSRSRGEIWEKGKTSGNTQELISCRADCDRDALLFTVRQKGPACHSGLYSCFGTKKFNLSRLFDVLNERKRDLPDGSYSVTLMKDRQMLFRKIMEEAFETTHAKSRAEFIWEIADTIYMLSVLASDEKISWQEIESELSGRNK